MKQEISEAIEVLKNGGIILYPTDTVWGLGCDATNAEAVEKIYKIKNRNDSKSLIILAADLDMVCRYVKEIPQMAITLVEVNDKPMTIIYPEALKGPKGIYLADNVVAEDGSIAIRIPMHDFCKELIKRFRKPIVSTSANISGEETPESFDQINGEIIKAADWTADPIYENGATGKPSSIIKLGLNDEVKIIRA